jgi:hypothetical protein
MLLLATHTDKVECADAETSPLNSSFQVHFAAHFPTCTVRCQCNNADLQFVLVEQIHNAQFLNVKKKKR